MTEHPTASILVAHHDATTRAHLEAILTELDHEVVASVDSREGLLECARKQLPDLLLSSFYLRDGESIGALIEVSEDMPVPAVIVTKHDDLDRVERALEDHVMAYLVEPVTAEELRPTIYLVQRRFAEFEELRKEVETLEDALESRKVVERAKGYLMREHDLSEEDAHRRLQKIASEKRRKLRDVADAILLAADV